MKLRILIITACIFALIAAPAYAKIWRVDNNPANEADYRTIQDAHDGASEGDTLYVAGSGISYGNLNLTKTLYIFGPGYFLEENPETQAWPVSANIVTITFDAGSEGSSIAGLNTSSYYSYITVNANNINVRNTYAYYITISYGVSNCIIMQNYVQNNVSVANECQNIIITNNIIPTEGISASYGDSSADIQYNLIGGSISISNSIFNNNILVGTSDFTQTNCSIGNNISSGEQVGTDNGNQSNVDTSTVFVGPEGNSTDGQWQLAEGSPAAGAGTDGTDIGPFGGSTPYILSGMPNIPHIYFFTSPAATSEESGLPVHLKAKSEGK